MSPGSALALQRAVGNRAAGALLTRARVQRVVDETSEEIGQLAALQRQSRRPPISREAERTLSQTTPGQAQLVPGSLSIYNFAIDSAQLKPFHQAALRELAEFLAHDAPVDATIRISGHADSSGPDAHNTTLSQNRAEAVAAVLRSTGLNVEVTASGAGAPIAGNDSVDGRSRNRRVDVRMNLAPRRPPVPDPNPPVPAPDPSRGFCDRYPILCSLTPVIPFIPPPFPLLCVLAPEICIVLPCLVNPAMCVPPPPPPPPPGPVDPDRPDPTRPDPSQGPHVEFGPVRAANTPGAMPDRIPNQGAVPVGALVTGYDPSQGPIVVRVSGAGSANGEATINGSPTATISGTTILGVAGTTMTAVFHLAYNLRLEAVLNGAVIGQSGNPFAVVPIMENMNARHSRNVVDATGASMFAMMSWQSDGAGGIRSLDGLEYQEHLRVDEETGGMVGMGPGGHGNQILADQDQEDQHGTVMDRMIRRGSQRLTQVHAMLDHRGGAMDIPVKGSGFALLREVINDPDRPGCLVFHIDKSGQGGEADGIRSDAGTGTSSLRVPIPCDSPAGPTGAGQDPAVPTIPVPFTGTPPTGTTPIRYEGGVPASAAVGDLVTLRFSFLIDGQLFISAMPCEVVALTRDAVRIQSLNPIAVNVAPPGREPIVMGPNKIMNVPRRMLQ